jgi:protocatechuate 3,4-dioxygenase beta subunit
MGRSRNLALVLVCTALAAGQSENSMEITGRVFDDQMRRVTDADVALYELHGDDCYSPRRAKLLHPVTRTDSEGGFVFRVSTEPHCDIYAVARKETMALGWDYLHREDSFFQRLEKKMSVVLAKPHTLAGRLVDSEGTPVEGARVQMCKGEGRGGGKVCEPLDWFSVKTDHAGKFLLRQLPIDLTVALHVHVPGFDIVHTFPHQGLGGNACGGYYPDGEEVVLQLPPVSTVRGRVIDRTTGRGLRGLDLMLRPIQDPDATWRFRPCAVTAGTQGRFEISGVPPGRHLLSLVSPKTDPSIYVGKNVVVRVKENKPAQTEIIAERGIPLDVTVRDKETGILLSDMKVFVDDREHPGQQDIFMREIPTEASGIARLFVPKGTFNICALGGNHNNVQNMEIVRVRIDGPRSAPVQVYARTLLPLVRGIVVDARGQPVENAVITVGLGQRVLTDKQGCFEGRQNPLYPSHLVIAQDEQQNLAEAAFFFNARRELRLVLKPTIEIQGRVTDENGHGIPGARVTLSLNCRRRGGARDVSGTAHLPVTLTEADGSYRLATLVPIQGGFSYMLDIIAPGFGGAFHTLEDSTQPGTSVTVPDMKLQRADASVSGVVLDPQGRTVAGKPVFAHSPQRLSSHDATSTDAQGRFKFNRMTDGHVTLQVGFGQGSDAAFVHAHSGDHVTIVLGEHFKDYLSPTSLAGRPLPDLASLEIAFDSRRTRNKKVLVCFVDYTQRRSQKAIRFVNDRLRDIAHRNIEVVCIQVTPIGEEALRDWKRDNKVRIPIEVLPGDKWWRENKKLSPLTNTERSRSLLKRRWGVRSLPWTLLADENGKIVATGFEIHRVYTLVPENKKSPMRLNRDRTRR